MAKVYDKQGKEHAREMVDAREMVATGEYTMNPRAKWDEGKSRFMGTGEPQGDDGDVDRVQSYADVIAQRAAVRRDATLQAQGEYLMEPVERAAAEAFNANDPVQQAERRAHRAEEDARRITRASAARPEDAYLAADAEDARERHEQARKAVERAREQAAAREEAARNQSRDVRIANAEKASGTKDPSKPTGGKTTPSTPANPTTASNTPAR
jgi:hypothetical protein